jgi:putative FmdB family regulatory protein
VPLYEYQCPQCGRFEVIRKFSDPALTACPTCGREVQKLLSAPAIQFKGTGWYITDYARKGSGSEGGKDKKGGEQKSESKSDSKPESKSESKSDSKSDSGDSGGKADSSDSTSKTTPSKSNSA